MLVGILSHGHKGFVLPHLFVCLVNPVGCFPFPQMMNPDSALRGLSSFGTRSEPIEKKEPTKLRSSSRKTADDKLEDFLRKSPTQGVARSKSSKSNSKHRRKIKSDDTMPTANLSDNSDEKPRRRRRNTPSHHQSTNAHDNFDCGFVLAGHQSMISMDDFQQSKSSFGSFSKETKKPPSRSNSSRPPSRSRRSKTPVERSERRVRRTVSEDEVHSFFHSQRQNRSILRFEDEHNQSMRFDELKKDNDDDDSAQRELLETGIVSHKQLEQIMAAGFRIVYDER